MVKELKILGLVFDGKLSWFGHLDHLRSRVLAFSSTIRRLGGANWGINKLILKDWYLLVTERQIAYASPVWIGDLNCHARRKLNSIQRTAILPIAGAYKTTSIAALGIILGIPPITLKLNNIKLSFKLKFLKQSIQIANTTINSTEIDYKLPSYNYNYISHIRNLHHLPDNSVPSNHTHPIIYTDGSKMDSGTALAYVVHLNKSPIDSSVHKLNAHNTIFQAELMAISLAVDWALTSQHTNVTILTDSKSSKLSLEQLQPDNTLTNTILNKIKNSPSINYNIGWIRGHNNTDGNEQADTLAKSPLLDPNVQCNTINIPLAPSYVKDQLKKHLLNTWKEHWHTDPSGLYTFNFIQSPTLFLQTDDQVVLYFLSGHGSFPSFLHKIGRRDDNLCECGAVGHPLHYIFEHCLLMPHTFKSNKNLN